MSKEAIAILLIFLSLLFPVIPAAAQDQDQKIYLNLLVKEALQKSLSEERYWHLLLHYKKTIFGKLESEQENPAFFNAPSGKFDPQAELIATLEAFFMPAEAVGPNRSHPQCDFAARYRWLKVRLSFDPARLPEQRCERLDSWLQELDPEKIALIFSASYMNNPASMFGHTLLRIDKKRRGPNQALLNVGVNYAAMADTRSTLLYVFKGLFGGFKGSFSIFPYYVKVQEYNNMESRDLWEYELNFTEEQMNALLLHLWELGGNYFDYYYFQGNCSYQLLSLLEVANPDLHLTDQFLFQVIPGDTVKVLTRHDAMIVKRVYRPSLLSQMNNKRRRMTESEKKIFYRLVKDQSEIETQEFDRLPVPSKGLVLDAYLDYAQYQTMKRERTAEVIDKKTREVLLARSRLDDLPAASPSILPLSTPPELGHGSARVRIGMGQNQDEFFEEISIRPAYHDLLAKETGYAKDSQILFFEATARYYDETKRARLDQFKVIDIISLTPYDPLFRKKSWRLSLGLDTLRDPDCSYCHSFKGNYGIGFAYRGPAQLEFNEAPLLLYTLLQVEGELSGRLNPDYRLGGGAVIGAILDAGDRWRIHLAGSYLNFPLGHQSDYYKIGLDQRYLISRNIDIRVELSTLNSRKESVAAVNYYF